MHTVPSLKFLPLILPRVVLPIPLPQLNVVSQHTLPPEELPSKGRALPTAVPVFGFYVQPTLLMPLEHSFADSNTAKLFTTKYLEFQITYFQYSHNS